MKLNNLFYFFSFFLFIAHINHIRDVAGIDHIGIGKLKGTENWKYKKILTEIDEVKIV